MASVENEVASTLKAIRGKVRRTEEGVEKERASLLALQIANGVPRKLIARQLIVIFGAPSGGATT